MGRTTTSSAGYRNSLRRRLPTPSSSSPWRLDHKAAPDRTNDRSFMPVARGWILRPKLAFVLLCGAFLVATARVQAADPSDVFLGPPDSLMIGIIFSEEAGTYQQQTEIRNDEIRADLTFQLPPAATNAHAGAVVVFWQYMIDAALTDYGDITQRIVGAPVVEAVLPDCDAAGACQVQFQAHGSITPALEAADLDGLESPALRVGVTLVRTFGDGTLLQVVRPRLGSGVGGGSLASPSNIHGGLTLSAIIPAEDATTAEIPGGTFGHGAPPYAWGAALAAALASPTPTASVMPTGSESALPTPTPSPSPGPQDPRSPPSPAIAVVLAALVVAAALILFRLRRKSWSGLGGGTRG